MHQIGISWIAVYVLHVSNPTDGSKSATSMYPWSAYWKIRDMSVNNIGEIITRKYIGYVHIHWHIYNSYKMIL